jgi:preprotein translocase subunit SecB
MDKNQSPGIEISHISLVECCLRDLNLANDLRYNLGIEKLQRRILSEEQLIVQVAFDLMQGVEDAPYSFTCSFVASYTRSENSNMKWEEFKDGLIVAHILPYVREFVSSVSLRLPLAPLVLPPINAFLLVENYEKRNAKVSKGTEGK